MDYAIIERNAFVFCRYSVAALVWAALLARSEVLLAAVFVILALSAWLTVKRAPMILLYSFTLGRVLQSDEDVLDITAMRVAHTAGAVMALACLILLYLNSPAAWPAVFVFALLKTLSAVGFCPAYKLYGCLAAGGCCALTGKK